MLDLIIISAVGKWIFWYPSSHVEGDESDPEEWKRRWGRGGRWCPVTVCGNVAHSIYGSLITETRVPMFGCSQIVYWTLRTFIIHNFILMVKNVGIWFGLKSVEPTWANCCGILRSSHETAPAQALAPRRASGSILGDDRLSPHCKASLSGKNMF